jgi:hypothetical protein
MVLLQLGLGLLGSISGLLAVVAGQRVEPFYSYLARIFPSTRSLYAAREVISEQDRIRIRNGYQNELETAHEVFIDEFDFHEQYQPTKLRFMHNSFELEYADRRKQGRRKTSKEAVLELFDSRISEALGTISAYAAIVCVLAFAALILTAVI